MHRLDQAKLEMLLGNITETELKKIKEEVEESIRLKQGFNRDQSINETDALVQDTRKLLVPDKTMFLSNGSQNEEDNGEKPI